MLRTQRSVSLNNTCDALFDEAELVSAMLWYSEKPICQVKKVSLHARYPAVSLGKNKFHIHRLLMMYWLQCKQISGYSIHHLDGNGLNATRANLSLYPNGSHASLHNAGKVLSESHKRKIGLGNHSRKGQRMGYRKKAITPRMVYQMKRDGYSFRQISLTLNLDWSCVKQRYDDFIHDNPELMEANANAHD